MNSNLLQYLIDEIINANVSNCNITTELQLRTFVVPLASLCKQAVSFFIDYAKKGLNHCRNFTSNIGLLAAGGKQYTN